MRSPQSVPALEQLGRVQLSKSFFMREFLYSEIAQIHGLPNIPEDPDLAIEVGRKLCEEVLEPIQGALGRITIRSAYRSPAVNALGNERGYNCASNEKNYTRHIWDRLDAHGQRGATATVVVTRVVPYYEATADWQALAWWIHDHVPSYADMVFFPKLAAFNISWHERPTKTISSYVDPKGVLTRPGLPNHAGSHQSHYAPLLQWLADPSLPTDGEG
ncbi:MAG: peptidase M15 [Candidatus Competibacterales bacterium]